MKILLINDNDVILWESNSYHPKVDTMDIATLLEHYNLTQAYLDFIITRKTESFLKFANIMAYHCIRFNNTNHIGNNELFDLFTWDFPKLRLPKFVIEQEPSDADDKLNIFVDFADVMPLEKAKRITRDRYLSGYDTPDDYYFKTLFNAWQVTAMLADAEWVTVEELIAEVCSRLPPPADCLPEEIEENLCVLIAMLAVAQIQLSNTGGVSDEDLYKMIHSQFLSLPVERIGHEYQPLRIIDVHRKLVFDEIGPVEFIGFCSILAYECAETPFEERDNQLKVFYESMDMEQ